MALALAVALASVGCARAAAAVCRSATIPARACSRRRVATLLEISRANRVPHLSVCGGKARCSTCRVRVLAGLEDLPAPRTRRCGCCAASAPTPTCASPARSGRARRSTVTRLLNPETAAPALAGGLEAAGVVRIAAVLFRRHPRLHPRSARRSSPSTSSISSTPSSPRPAARSRPAAAASTNTWATA